MDIVQIVGKRRLNFAAKDGGQVDGTQYFYTMQDINTEGMATGKLFIPSKATTQFGFLPEVGDTVKVEYNRYGRPAAFEAV